jgi:hypothetical protein
MGRGIKATRPFCNSSCHLRSELQKTTNYRFICVWCCIWSADCKLDVASTILSSNVEDLLRMLDPIPETNKHGALFDTLSEDCFRIFRPTTERLTLSTSFRLPFPQTVHTRTTHLYYHTLYSISHPIHYISLSTSSILSHHQMLKSDETN